MSTYAVKNHYLRKCPFQENDEPIGNAATTHGIRKATADAR
jgi:hypothetical protein